MVPETLVLDGATDSVPRARRFVTAALAGSSAAAVSAAALVVTELVTNAVLHGAPPIVVRVSESDGGARIEVEDAGRELPLLPQPNAEAMTGRGLALVSVLAGAWGVESGAGGRKIVWAEVSGDGEPGDEAAPAPSAPDGLGGPQVAGPGTSAHELLHTVRIGSVPTDLLLAAKGHVDNIVREFTLAASAGALSGGAPPPGLMELIETVTSGFASARTQIKRQAVAAAERGDAETDLVLTAPASAADAGERYLAALDDADRYARSAQLLTLESPPVHRVFRRWYVQALVDRIRALSRGEPQPPPRTFPQALAEEVGRLATMRAASDRLAVLQQITGELARARTVSDIATAMTTQAPRSLGALSARVYLLRGDGMLRSLAQHGGSEAWVGKDEELHVSADLPGAEVMRTGRPVILRGQAQIAARYPALADVYPDERSLHVAPLIVGSPIGVLSLTFPIVGMDEGTQASFVATLADTLAQTLERALGLERIAAANAALAAANERLAFLAEASVVLSGTLDYAATVDEVARLMVPRLADWCSVQLLEDGQLQTVAIGHSEPERVVWAQELTRRYPPRMDVDTGAANVVRTGRSELYPEISDEMLTQSAVDAGHLELIREAGLSSALIVPLRTAEVTVGVINLVYAESGRRYSTMDVAFAEDIARRAAQALRSAAVYRDQSGELADVRRVADAAQQAILAPPPPVIGPVALAARYVGAAAEARVGGDLYEVVSRPGAVRLLIGDVRGKGLTAVRTATIVLGEFRAVAADLDDLTAIAVRLDRRLRPYLGDEDFVTALLAEIRDDGVFAVASCGHPPALLLTDNQIMEVGGPYGLPLGLGANPAVATGTMRAGDRLLLYTDGAIEARDSAGAFVELPDLLRPALGQDLGGTLDAVLAALRRAVGTELGDDLALLLAEYRGHGPAATGAR